MMSGPDLTTYWRDLAIIDLPLINHNENLHPLSRNEMLPWGNHGAPSAPYRISLAILPHGDIIQPLLSLLSLPLDTQKPVFPSHQNTYLASFHVDPNGVPLPSSAWMHVSLAAVKTYEIEGNLEKLADYHQKAIEAFRKKLDIGKALDGDRICFLIDWLQTFLPRGCEFMSNIELHTLNSPFAYWPATRITVPQASKQYRALRQYRQFLQQPVSPSTFLQPLDAQLIELHRAVLEPPSRFFPIHTGAETTRTQLVIEIANYYLRRYVQKLPRRHFEVAHITENLIRSPVAGRSAGVVVFSDNVSWLSELEQSFTFASGDPLLAYSFATAFPQTTGVPLGASAAPFEDDIPFEKPLYAELSDAAYQIMKKIDNLNLLSKRLEELIPSLRRSIDGQAAVEEALAALKNVGQPSRIKTLERKIDQWKHEIADLTKRLATTVESLAKSRIMNSIKIRKSKIASAYWDIFDTDNRQKTKAASQRKDLSARLPQQILRQAFHILASDFNENLLQAYNCLAIDHPDAIPAIIEKINADMLKMTEPSTILSARALRAFVAHTAPIYQELLVEYKNLAKQYSHTYHEKKRLLRLNKHLFMLYPVRLVPLQYGASYLNELDTSKLQVAIIDGTMPPDHLLLTQICRHFAKVIFLDGEKEHLIRTAAPLQLKEALRRKHMLTDLPSDEQQAVFYR